MDPALAVDCPGRAYKEGDRRAYDRIVRDYGERLYRLAYRILRDRDEAWDVSQEALIKVYEKIDSWDGESSFYTWIYRITSNLAIDRHRRRARQARAYERLPALGVSEDADEAEREEMLDRLSQAIDSLPPAQKAIVVLRHCEGMSLEDIALTRGRALGTIKSTLFQAFQSLRRALKPDTQSQEIH